MTSPRILIDGFNLAMRHGTGIKTYTQLLDSALRSASAETTFLFGREVPAEADPLLREVLFYDEVALHNRSPAARIQRIADEWIKAGFARSPKIRRVPETGVVVLADAASRTSERALNGSRLYDIAWRRSLSFKKFLNVDLPEYFDAVHMTYPLPLNIRSNAKKILTIHDLIPLRLPYTTMDNKAELLRRHRELAAEADLIFTVSEFSKQDIVKVLGVDPAKIAVTYQPSRFAPLRQTELRERTNTLRRYGLGEKGYVLFVGAIEPKKNLGRLLRAYAEANIDIPIVVAGPKGWMWQEEVGWAAESKDPLIQNKIRFLDHLSMDDLRFVISGALALAFPSLYEGYGLPVVEAMGFGVPVLTSRSSSLPEVCGEAALYVDPYDTQDIREKIERLVRDQALRDYLSERGISRSEQLSAAAFADQVTAGYQKIGLLT